MLKRCILFLHLLLAIFYSKSIVASISCFASTASADKYDEPTDDTATGCYLEVPLSFQHGSARFRKRMTLGIARQRVEGVSCSFTKQGVLLQTGKFKDEAFMNRSGGFRILCNCDSSGCNGMYESFESYVGTVKSLLECKTILQLIIDMKRGAVIGPSEDQMKDFFRRHNLLWPRPDSGSLFTIIAIIAAVVLLAAAGLGIAVTRNKRLQALVRMQLEKFGLRQRPPMALIASTTRVSRMSSTTASAFSRTRHTSFSTARPAASTSSRIRGGSEEQDSKECTETI